MADVLDVLTEHQAFEALRGLKGPSDATRVAGMVTAVSRRLDEACGPIVARLVTEEHDDACGTIFLAGKPYAVEADEEADPPVEATPDPIVTEAWSSEAPVALLAADYRLRSDGVAGRLTRWSGRWAPIVSVTYTAGRFATTQDVTEPFITAAGMLLQHWWRPSNGGGSETYGLAPGFLATGIPSFGFPNTVRDVLAGEMLAPAVA